MYTIQTFNKISEKGLSRFDANTYQVSADASAPEAILLRSQKLQASDIGESVLGIARAGAGVNNIPVADMTARGVVVFNTPGANANAVKELVLCGMLLASRDILGGIDFVANEQKETDNAALHKLLEAEKKRFAGSEIAGKTLGVVGLGAIGALVANMALDLGMEVLGYDPAISVEAAWKLSHRVERVESLNALAARADFITLHLPVLDSTRGLINADFLSNCKANAVLLNFAREEIVDTQALLAALDNKQVRKYICDFPVLEFAGRKDIIAMPHIGASTEEAEENCAVMAAEQLKDFLVNGNILNSVNFPKTHLDRTSGTRLAITNQNVPKMLGQILSVIADSDNNVLDMVNRSRGDIAYNLIDVANTPDEATIAKLRAIEGIVNLRVL